ncbi:class D beta-lactamase [Azospirillum doebereinerae]|uniref:class D beta-lactamase n=1 Tax=Azospirillum doebereinerae TaxID=92933 RepID=UPI001EE5896A|nr:class D beta-lactamase [Azospirillum doebereinerae]MCG5242735.1 class D beta-lactamase [Azospirillum doebereinerae]
MAIDRRVFTKGICIGLGAAALSGPFGALAATPAKQADKQAGKQPDGRIVCSVVLDAATGAVMFRDGPCADRVTPVSTFKIPLALMGFDAGILTGAHEPVWDHPRNQTLSERERQATDPTIWERDSIVWYSQELTRRLGMARFQDYVNRLGYGNRDLSGNPGKKDGLTRSWLMSSLAISPDEQVAFLRRMLDRKLPVSARSQEMTAAILPQFSAEDGWTVWGKTGSGWRRNADGTPDRSRPQGWFVGWAERSGGRVVFARLEIGDRPSDTPSGMAARAALLAELPGMARQ